MSPVVVLMAGLPGSGKSTLARALAARLGGVVLDKDRIRAALFSDEWIEYSPTQDDFCVDLLLRTAAYFTHKQAPPPYIFIDGRTFAASRQIDAVLQYVASLGAIAKIIYVVCPDDLARQRLTEPHLAKNRNYALYLKRKAEFEPIGPAHLTVDTADSLERCVERCLTYLTAAKPAV